MDHSTPDHLARALAARLRQLPQTLGPFDPLSVILKTYPAWVAGAVGLGALVWSDYRAWKAYGTGGFGANPAVWLFMTLVRAGRLVLGQDGRSTAGLVKNARQRGERGQVRFLGALDAREGARPAIVGRILPHRHHPQTSVSAPLAADIMTYIERLCAANPTLLAFATSNLEQHGPAILVGPGSTFPEGEAFSRAWGAGEIAHLHGQDASLHVSLSPLDAAEVIEKGWGERFPLAGAVSRVPVGYVMLYAARNDLEAAVIKQVLLAGCRWTAGADVVDVAHAE